MSLNTLPADRLPAVRAVHGTAIAVRVRLPSRRSTAWLTVTGALALSSGAAGAVAVGNGSDVGGWLIAGAGVVGVAVLLRAADLHRSRR